MIKLDRRTKPWRNRYMTLGKITLGVLIALVMYSILSFSIHPRPLISPLSDVQGMSSPTPTPERVTLDPIDRIRYEGEKRGVPNRDIRTMIRISFCESGHRASAKNPTSSATGQFQFLKGSWAYYACAGERTNFIDSIECAFKAYELDSFRPWNASRYCWEEV